jgi:signal transduction histidine kinase
MDRAARLLRIPDPRVLGGVLLVLLVAFAAAFAWQSWHQVREEQVRVQGSIVQIGERALDSYFVQMEAALGELRDRAIGPDPRLDVQRGLELLRRFRDRHPELTNIIFIRGDGQILFSAREPPPGAPPSIAEQPSFRDYLATKPVDGQLDIGRPLEDKLFGTWIVPMRLSIAGPGGELRYVISATLPVEFLHAFWKDAPVTQNTPVGLLRDDGYLLSRHPVPSQASPEKIYGEPRTGALGTHLRDARQPRSGTIEGPNSLEGSDFLITFRKLAHYPVTLFAATPVADIRDHWWRAVQTPFFLLVALFVAVLGATGLLLRAQATLRASEGKFRSLAELSSDWYWEQDAQFRFIETQGRGPLRGGITAGEHIGKCRWELPNTQPVGADWERHKAQLERHEPFRDLLLQRIGTDQREHYVTVSGEPVFGPGEVFLGYRGVASDVTDRVRAEKALAALNAELETRVIQRTADLELANRELGAFSYSVAHDLRAPVRAIIGFTSVVMEQSQGCLDPKSLELLQRVRLASENMGTLIDELLNLTRVSRQDLLRRDLDLSALAREVGEGLAQAHPERPVAFTVEPGLRAHADPVLTKVALENLLGNAWKFSGRTPEPQVSFRSERRDGAVAYFVSDNGAGFDMRFAEKLFMPFERLHHASEFEGTGIGLSIVKRIIAKHGGRVWAEGRPGKGATFGFTLG